MIVTTRRPTTATVRPDRRKRTTLYQRLFASYAAVLTLAVLLLIFAPVTISVPVTTAELAVLLAGFVARTRTRHGARRVVRGARRTEPQSGSGVPRGSWRRAAHASPQSLPADGGTA